MAIENLTIKGAKEHNLKEIDVVIPRDELVVITGVSGSGKSSLAFDTIFAEGQRRYVESLSSYARQFLMQMEKPRVESIEGLSPSVAIQQKKPRHNPRSTVATTTEIYDYLRLLFARVGEVHCYECGSRLEEQSVDQIVRGVMEGGEGGEAMILAPVVRGRKGEYRETLDNLVKQGFDEGRIDGEMRDLYDDIDLERYKKHDIDVVIDRLVLTDDDRERLAADIEMALKLGDGVVRFVLDERENVVTETMACSKCDVSYEELNPRVFSFNSPYGACPECNGLGKTMDIDPDLVVPEKEKTVVEGAILSMPKSNTSFTFRALRNVADHYGIRLDVPFGDLPEEHKNVILYGTGRENINFKFTGERSDKDYHWEYNRPYEGVIPRLERRMKETQSSRIRREIGQYLSRRNCPACGGARLRKESRSVFIDGKSISETTGMSVKDAHAFFEEVEFDDSDMMIAGPVLKEVKARLRFMMNVGLEYLTLDRSADTLSSGEAQRIQLATQIGSKLCGVLYILDEPSIGLHQRDIGRLLDILTEMRDLGNTVIVVEHDEETIRRGDHVIDMGPGAGDHGGEVVVDGDLVEVLECDDSVTGAFLRGEEKIEVPSQRREGNGRSLMVKGAREHNLKNLDIRFPTGKFICVTGVSGSGKSTLVNDITYKALARRFHHSTAIPGDHDEILGAGVLDKVIIIDQSAIGRTPRSNPGTYTSVFTPIRELFAELPEARKRGYKKGRFSFNVKGGRCEACGGAGSNMIEMHFLPDVYVKCDVCEGKRYNTETMEVRYKGKNIADVLDMRVEEALEFFRNISPVKKKLQTLYDVGLGYMKIGQPATTLSGGEAQRIKLSKELGKKSTGSTLYILDEPTTGLHFADIRKLIDVLDRLVDAGNTVIVIEHNLDVVKCADHIIDLGPEGGEEGGRIVGTGTPEELTEVSDSYTGKYLKRVL